MLCSWVEMKPQMNLTLLALQPRRSANRPWFAALRLVNTHGKFESPRCNPAAANRGRFAVRELRQIANLRHGFIQTCEQTLLAFILFYFAMSCYLLCGGGVSLGNAD